MSASADFNNPLRKFKLVFLGEQSGKCVEWRACSYRGGPGKERRTQSSRSRLTYEVVCAF